MVIFHSYVKLPERVTSPFFVPRHLRRRLGGKPLGCQEERAAGAAHRCWSSGLGRRVCCDEVLGQEVRQTSEGSALRCLAMENGHRNSGFSHEKW